MTLFKMWENAYINKTLPPEWPIWEDCRTWAINNRYKAEYGYKGEFSPQGCLKAIPGYKDGLDAGTVIVDEFVPDPDKCEIVGIDLAGGLDKTAIQKPALKTEEIAKEFNIPIEMLAGASDEFAIWLEINGTITSLKKYAKEMGIELGEAKTKKEIVAIIAEGGMTNARKKTNTRSRSRKSV